MELKALPDASRPTRRQTSLPTVASANVKVKTLDTLWIENATSASPVATMAPPTGSTAMPKWLTSALANSGI